MPPAAFFMTQEDRQQATSCETRRSHHRAITAAEPEAELLRRCPRARFWFDVYKRSE